MSVQSVANTVQGGHGIYKQKIQKIETKFHIIFFIKKQKQTLKCKPLQNCLCFVKNERVIS